MLLPASRIFLLVLVFLFLKIEVPLVRVCWQCQVGLFLSLGSYLIARKIWKDRLKGFKKQTSYSSVIAQADRSFIKQTLPTHGSRPTPKESSSQPISASLFLYFLPPSLVVPVQNRTCTHHQSGKKMQMGIHSRLIDSCKLYNNRLFHMSSNNSVCYNQMHVCIE